ncbi:MAG TPA: hypothetical protein VK008_06355 [Sphingobacteriaceae bacterium]|nr:hypothetical protein [Sphingobacteriaceae bacterium]
MTVSPLAFDIETVGVDWDSLEPEIQEYLLSRAKTDEERRTVPERLGLHPGTGRVVAIGLWRPEEKRGGVLLEGEPADWSPFEDNAQIFRGSEERILKEFWRYVRDHAGTLISYNGRAFDGPFLMLRSVLLGVAPTRNLVPYRYSFKDHCDLAEVVTFFRARPMESFDFWCRRFGLASPKEGMDGSAVADYYAAGDLLAIGRYCLADARQTAELYLRLLPLIQLHDGTGG